MLKINMIKNIRTFAPDIAIVLHQCYQIDLFARACPLLHEKMWRYLSVALKNQPQFNRK